MPRAIRPTTTTTDAGFSLLAGQTTPESLEVYYLKAWNRSPQIWDPEFATADRLYRTIKLLGSFFNQLKQRLGGLIVVVCAFRRPVNKPVQSNA